MGLTLTEKIIKAHIIDGEMVKGTEIGLKIDQTLTQDATGTWLTSSSRLWALTA